MVENMPENWKLMVLLASWCALRHGEIAELRRKDIKFRQVNGRWTGVIQVRRGVVWVNRKIQVEPPKSEAGIRDVAIPPHLIPIIKEHLEAVAAPGQKGLLFPPANGRQESQSTVTNYFRKAAEIAGRSDLRFHGLRHTGSVMAAQQGTTLADLHGSVGALNGRRSPALSAHGEGSRSTHCGTPLRPIEVSPISDEQCNRARPT